MLDQRASVGAKGTRTLAPADGGRVIRRPHRPPEGHPGRRPVRRLPRDEANAILARNPGMIASFSRALTEGLTAQQTDDEFNVALDAAIGSIFAASKT